MITLMPQIAVARVANGYIVVTTVGQHAVLCATRQDVLRAVDAVLAEVPIGFAPPSSEYGKMLDDVANGLQIPTDALRTAVKSHQFGISPWGEQ